MSHRANTPRLVFWEALVTGVITFLLLAPITALVLDGYNVVSHWDRPLFWAAVAFTGRLLIGWLLLTHQGRSLYERLLHSNSHAITVQSPSPPYYRWLWWVLLLLTLCLPAVLNKYWLNVAILALIYVLLGLGLNIVVGMAGLLDLGYVAFYAVGAYTCALGHHYLGLGFWSALPLAALLAALFGLLLGFPVLRMHGDYLAIVTLGFGEIIRLVLNNWVHVTGGPNGMAAPYPTLFGLEFNRRAATGQQTFHQFFGIDYANSHRYIFIYLVLLLVVAGIIVLARRLKQMPLGRAWDALRADEIACRSLGINHVTVKLSAFSMGAMIGGLGGVFFATSQGFVNPTSFTFFESALILAVVVLGGMGSVIGVICAALLLTILPEAMREFSDYRILLFGVTMVLMMIWRPSGLLRARRQLFPV
ncbi:MAG: high-affinity branched-chain amino acid ABC transporter permease LivM [Magnetococcales bacterium]|nr:high-affinity branched-chain amino acid ABC transporter permease LivM [Magnetococcales bacterium]